MFLDIFWAKEDLQKLCFFSGALFSGIWRSFLGGLGSPLVSSWVAFGFAGSGWAAVRHFLGRRFCAENGHLDFARMQKKQTVLGPFMRQGWFLEMVNGEVHFSEITCFLLVFVVFVGLGRRFCAENCHLDDARMQKNKWFWARLCAKGGF